jgi:hypothetical protein
MVLKVALWCNMGQYGAIWCIISPYSLHFLIWATKNHIGQQIDNKFNEKKEIGQQIKEI